MGFRIGKLFHLTPLVDSIADAEFFFSSVFAPVCIMRGYSPHWHRHGAIYVIAETSIEPMQPLPPPPGPRGYELVPVHGQVRPARPQHRVLRRERASARRRASPRPGCARRTAARRARSSPIRRTLRGCSSSTSPLASFVPIGATRGSARTGPRCVTTSGRCATRSVSSVCRTSPWSSTTSSQHLAFYVDVLGCDPARRPGVVRGRCRRALRDGG